MSDRIEVYISEEDIKNRVKQLGEMITRDYKDRQSNLLLIAILKGSVVFLSDIIRAIDIPLAIDFMIISSYDSGTESKGNVKIIKDLDINISDYDILIIEDILDSGYTLSKVIEMLKTRKPKSLKICAFLDKHERRIAPVSLDYMGFTIKDEFVVGYGLDYNEKYRNLPYIGILTLDK